MKRLILIFAALACGTANAQYRTVTTTRTYEYAPIVRRVVTYRPRRYLLVEVVPAKPVRQAEALKTEAVETVEVPVEVIEAPIIVRRRWLIPRLTYSNLEYTPTGFVRTRVWSR